jgi:MFS transporter, DHA1 family, multidrug resistance protein
METAVSSATRPPLVVLVTISMLQPFALNVLSPATPGLTRSLQTDYATVQLTLTFYLLAVAITQFFVGPISDRFGRRPCILAGIGLFLLGSLAGALAFRIETLLIARVVQGIGGGACFALARAVVQDSASKDESASLIGYITMAMVVSPMVAPLVGGFLDARFGWRSIFVATSVLTLVVAVAAVLLLRETAPPGKPSSLRNLASGYPELLRNRAFMGYCLALTFTTASFYAFIAAAPYLVVDVMARSPDVYGAYFVVNAGGYMVGSFLSGRFGQRLGSERLTSLGIALALVAMAIEVACLVALPWGPAALFLPLTLNFLANGLSIPGATASALSVRPQLAGTAAGLIGAAQLGFGALAAVAVGWLVTLWTPSLVVAMLGFVICSWISLALVPSRRD